MIHPSPGDKRDRRPSRPRRDQDPPRGRTRTRSRSHSRTRHQEPRPRGRRQCPGSRSSPAPAPARASANTQQRHLNTSIFPEYPRGRLSGRRSNEQVDTSLPKYFEKPLTCFFWHHNGRCNKRDEDCVYAHWETGYLAGAPLNFGGSLGTESVAGQRARNLTSAISNLMIDDLKDKEDTLRRREQELEERLEAISKKEKDLEKLVRLREKKLKLREKRVARKEEALTKAGSSAWTCSKCEAKEDYQGQ